jgi:hypothetical protein
VRSAIDRPGRALAIVSTLLVITICSAAVRAQRPGSGWVLKPSPDGSIQTLYWDLFKQTEIWMRLEPQLQSGGPAPLYVVLSTIVDGQKLRTPVESFDWQAQANPRLIVTRTSFALTLDRRQVIDLAAGPWPFTPVSGNNCDGNCPETGAIAHLPVAVSRRIAAARRLDGDVLGLQVTFTPDQIAAINRYIARVTLSEDDGARGPRNTP